MAGDQAQLPLVIFTGLLTVAVRLIGKRDEVVDFGETGTPTLQGGGPRRHGSPTGSIPQPSSRPMEAIRPSGRITIPMIPAPTCLGPWDLGCPTFARRASGMSTPPWQRISTSPKKNTSSSAGKSSTSKNDVCANRPAAAKRGPEGLRQPVR